LLTLIHPLIDQIIGQAFGRANKLGRTGFGLMIAFAIENGSFAHLRTQTSPSPYWPREDIRSEFWCFRRQVLAGRVGKGFLDWCLLSRKFRPRICRHVSPKSCFDEG
jgi:hypothetical protein